MNDTFIKQCILLKIEIIEISAEVQYFSFEYMNMIYIRYQLMFFPHYLSSLDEFLKKEIKNSSLIHYIVNVRSF